MEFDEQQSKLNRQYEDVIEGLKTIKTKGWEVVMKMIAQEHNSALEEMIGASIPGNFMHLQGKVVGLRMIQAIENRLNNDAAAILRARKNLQIGRAHV